MFENNYSYYQTKYVSFLYRKFSGFIADRNFVLNQTISIFINSLKYHLIFGEKNLQIKDAVSNCRIFFRIQLWNKTCRLPKSLFLNIIANTKLMFSKELFQNWTYFWIWCNPRRLLSFSKIFLYCLLYILSDTSFSEFNTHQLQRKK